MNKIMLAVLIVGIATLQVFAGVSVIGGYSLADQLKGTQSGDSFTTFMSGAPVLGLQYSDQINGDIGYEIGGLFFNDRLMTKGESGGVSYTLSDPKPILTITTIFGNLKYSVNQNIFVLGGVNFSSVHATQTSADLVGKLGYQAGVGYKLADNWVIEAICRVINFDAKYSSSTAEDSISGFELLTAYSF